MVKLKHVSLILISFLAITICLKPVLAHDLPQSFTGEYIQPNDPSVQAIINSECRFPLEENIYDNVRDLYYWVAQNTKYANDTEKYGVKDYWQIPATTIALGTGDCEDQAILLTSLIRAAGVPRENVHLTYAPTSPSSAHCWVEVYLDSIGWVPLDTVLGIELGIIDVPLLFETWIILRYTTYLSTPTAFYVDPPPQLKTLTATPHITLLNAEVTFFMEIADQEWHELDVTVTKPNGMPHTIMVYLRGRTTQSLLYGRDLETTIDQTGTYTVRVSEQWDDPLPESIYPDPKVRTRTIGETTFAVYEFNIIPEVPLGTISIIAAMILALGIMKKKSEN